MNHHNIVVSSWTIVGPIVAECWLKSLLSFMIDNDFQLEDNLPTMQLLRSEDRYTHNTRSDQLWLRRGGTGDPERVPTGSESHHPRRNYYSGRAMRNGPPPDNLHHNTPTSSTLGPELLLSRRHNGDRGTLGRWHKAAKQRIQWWWCSPNEQGLFHQILTGISKPSSEPRPAGSTIHDSTGHTHHPPLTQ
jgi:hypothetical protein